VAIRGIAILSLFCLTYTRCNVSKPYVQHMLENLVFVCKCQHPSITSQDFPQCVLCELFYDTD
jgi:hypothetical protein